MAKFVHLPDGFWIKVDKRGPKTPFVSTRCWVWTAGNNGKYGVVLPRPGAKRSEYVHRLSYRHKKGKIPKGYEIDHLCRTPLCVRPSHLEAVTHKENMRRALPFRPRRYKSVCKRGHDLSIYGHITPRGIRYCKVCQRMLETKYRRARGARERGSFIPRHNFVLTEDNVREIRRLYATGAYTYAVLATKFSVSQTSVCRYVKGVRYADL